MHWYLVHAKPKQEKRALYNLVQQGYVCYLPTLSTEKMHQGVLTLTDEPLFPRYLFIQLSRADSAKSWSPIRSTKGVCRLVSFGVNPAQIDDEVINLLKSQEAQNAGPERLFRPGERVKLSHGPLAGIEGVYQMADGERRVMVLIELLSRQVTLRVPLSSLRKAS